VFYIHIGAHKTGSSTLQDVFHANESVLAGCGIFYPEISNNRKAHTSLTREVFATVDDGRFGPSVTELAELAKAHPDRTFLLSSENFELFKEKHILHVLKAIAPHRIRIFGYIRDLTSSVPSKYNQRTKTGMNTRDIDEFCAHAEDWGQLEYFNSIKRWAKHAGWDNVRIRSLDKRSLTDGDLITDALSAIGIGGDVLARFDRDSLSPSNESPSWISVEFMRAAYAVLYAAPLDWEALAKQPRVSLRNIRQPGGERFQSRRLRDLDLACEKVDERLGLRRLKVQYLTPQQWSVLRENYVGQVERLNARLVDAKIPLPEDGAPPERPFVPAFDNVPADLRSAFLAAFGESVRWGRFPAELSAHLRPWLETLSASAGAPRPTAA